MSTNDKLQQESFFIYSDKNAKRKKLIRQDRWQIDPKTCFIANETLELEVFDLSHFGCASIVTAEQANALRKTLDSSIGSLYKLNYGPYETQTVSLRVVRIDKTDDDNKYTVGFETLNEPINVDRCKAINDATQLIDKQIKHLNAGSKIPHQFKASVFELKEWFSFLKQQIDEIEKKSPIDDAKSNEEFRLTIAETVAEYLGNFLPSVYKDIPAMLNGLSKEDNAQCVAFIRSQIGPYVYGAPFANRAYFKPRGYAGDFEMMNHLYRNEMVGKTLFDQCMHKYFIDEPAGNAVKNRGEYLHKKIKQLVQSKPAHETIKILSIASGPAMEVQLFIKNNPEFYGRKIEFTCIDQDEESLKHAQKQLLTIDRQKQSGFKFTFSNLAIKNIIAQGLQENDYDLIYSAGLFDYFTDPVAQLAAKQMFDGIKKNGEIIIGNFSKDNPCVPFMEYVLDWILLYRSKTEMEQLFKSIGGNVTVEQEPLGVNLFAVIHK